MIDLAQFQTDERIWRPAVRRMGHTAFPSAVPFTVKDVVKDKTIYFLSIEDEREIAYTIAFASPTGLVDDFHRSELNAVKDAFMRAHKHSGDPVITKKTVTFFAGGLFGAGFVLALTVFADWIATF